MVIMVTMMVDVDPVIIIQYTTYRARYCTDIKKQE